MTWGATIIADMHARGDHRGCRGACVQPRVEPVAVVPRYVPRFRRMTKPERLWAAKLVDDPLVKDARYEAVTLRLGPDCRFTPDFFVEYTDGAFGFDEVKGAYIRPDSLVKLRVAVGMFPRFRWRLAQWKGGVWRVEALT